MRIQHFPDLVKSTAWLGQLWLLCLVLRQDKERSSPESVLALGHTTVLCQTHNSVCSLWNGKYTLPLPQAQYPKTNTATWLREGVYAPRDEKEFSCSSPSNYKLESFHKTQFQSDMLPENHVSQRIFLPIQANDKTVTLWSRIIPMLTGKVPFLLPSTNNLTATRILVWFFVLFFGGFFTVDSHYITHLIPPHFC